MTRLMCALKPGGKIAVPVSAPSVLERIAADCGGEVIRVKANNRALQEASRQEGCVMAGNLDGKFIFPDFHSGFDAMATVGKLLEALATLNQPLADIVDQLPEFHHLHEAVACPWEQKGTVMRVLVEQNKHAKTELIDGVKVFNDTGWALVLPDPVDPVVHLYADATSAMQADQLIEDYAGLIRSMAEKEEVLV
jgi:mannose-1-phosphate guanylyltransferase/phosphomannomutase